MHILVDLQCFVSLSRNRGIGRYSYNLLKELKAQDTIENPLSIKGLLPSRLYGNFLESSAVSLFNRSEIVLFESDEANIDNFETINLTNRFSLFQAVKALQIDAFIQLSPLAEPATSWVSPDFLYDSIPTYSMFYDAITPPNNDEFEDFQFQRYLERLGYLKGIDSFFTISKKADQDLRLLLKKEIHSIVVGGGPTLELDLALPQTREAESPNFLFPGAGDPRKGADILVEAVNLLREKIPKETVFNLTSTDTQFGSNMLRKAQKYGIEHFFLFHPTLSDNEILKAYLNCSAVLFPSREEGLGLPILDAQAVGKPCLIASTQELLEICFDTEFTFETDSPLDLAEKLKNFLLDLNYRDKRSEVAHKASNSASQMWPKVSNLVRNYIINTHKTLSDHKRSLNEDKPELVFITPLPPEQTGIAYRNAILLEELDKLLTLDPNHSFNALTKVVTANNIILALGNSPHHSSAFSFMPFCHPIFDLHDASLDRFFETLPYDNINTSLAKYIFAEFGIQAINEMPSPIEVGVPLGTKLLKQITSFGKARIGHNTKASELLNCESNVPLWTKSSPVAKKSISNSAKRYIDVSSFGFIDQTKMLDTILLAIEKSIYRERIKLNIVGIGDPQLTSLLTDLARKMRVSVWFTGFVNENDYREILERTDVSIQLRNSTRLESPSSILDCLESNVPVISNYEIAFDIYKTNPLFFYEENLDNLSLRLDNLIQTSLLKENPESKGNVAIEHHVSNVAKTYYEIVQQKYGHHPRLSREKQKITEKVLDSQIKSNLANFKIQVITHNQLRTRIFLVLTDEITKTYVDGILRVSSNLYHEFSEKSNSALIPVIRKGSNFYVASKLGLMDANYQEIFQKFDLDMGIVVPNQQDLVIFPGMDGSLQEAEATLSTWKRQGIRIITIVHDVLPLSNPELFEEWFPGVFEKWIRTSLQVSTDIVFDSQVSYDSGISFLRSNSNGYLHTHVVTPVVRIPSKLMESKRNLNWYVMLGTIEPRKGHSLVLDEFEKLWQLGVDAKLIILGRVGWKSEQVVTRINELIRNGLDVTWLESPTDDVVNFFLTVAGTIICSSSHEGFCMPGLEAHAMGLKVIARDIPVYREVLSDFAYFFDTSRQVGTNSLSDVIMGINEGKGNRFKLNDEQQTHVSQLKSKALSWLSFLGNN